VCAIIPHEWGSEEGVSSIDRGETERRRCGVVSLAAESPEASSVVAHNRKWRWQRHPLLVKYAGVGLGWASVGQKAKWAGSCW
jgi:hypothetical protein